MIRKYGSVGGLAFLSTLVLFLQTLFTGNNAYLRVPIVFVSLVFVIAAVRYLEHRFAPPAVQTLRRILNSCAKQASSITTVAKFLVKTDEESLVRGDEVHIITNSLKGYDMTPPARAVIAGNLRDGVRYVYYVPNQVEYPSLEQEKDSFVRLVMEESGLPVKFIEENLRIYLVEEPCLFNFAIVLRAKSSKFEGYWYITTPAPPELDSDPKPNAAAHKADPSLVILRLGETLTGDLWNVVSHLRASSMRVSAVGIGLRPIRRKVFATRD